jgi:putative endonuclease
MKRPAAQARTTRQADGDRAERLAGEHLARHGLAVIARNYRCRTGEIDLVCADGDVTVFVEVRYRASARFGGAGASIDARKQARIVAAARHFLATRGASRAEGPCRFDAVLLDRLDAASIEWIRDAFGA